MGKLDLQVPQVSDLTARLDPELKQWRERSLSSVPHIILNATYLKVRVDSCVRSCAVLIAVGCCRQSGKRIRAGRFCCTQRSRRSPLEGVAVFSQATGVRGGGEVARSSRFHYFGCSRGDKECRYLRFPRRQMATMSIPSPTKCPGLCP
ncbi:MAG: transposase [Akkermansia sp.]